MGDTAATSRRQNEGDCRAGIGATFERQRAAVIRHDALRDGEAEADVAGLGRDERFEGVG
jgi:hypothetical protein